eukprot:Blabericola_migrator_1__133@NODE_1033_length_5646_cov_522_716437_g712_i0_p4_GENE_NODE_1033_length_5646_cov_522_716437_g712_i0NODE_1033_length_5646_cov_522_716437_g712_i0_p4_ORF_typecomplete_len216_score51_26_NODE_1033_length_5646_cov_522_716437_g712_i023432990
MGCSSSKSVDTVVTQKEELLQKEDATRKNDTPQTLTEIPSKEADINTEDPTSAGVSTQLTSELPKEEEEDDAKDADAPVVVNRKQGWEAPPGTEDELEVWEAFEREYLSSQARRAESNPLEAETLMRGEDDDELCVSKAPCPRAASATDMSFTKETNFKGLRSSDVETSRPNTSLLDRLKSVLVPDLPERDTYNPLTSSRNTWVSLLGSCQHPIN